MEIVFLRKTNMVTMRISDIDIVANYDIIEPLIMKDVGIMRLEKFVSWPHKTIPADWKNTFKVLSEFVVFNECFKIPFYIAFQKSLADKLENLYRPLFNDSLSIPDSAITSGEIFSFLSELGGEQAEKLIRVYGCANVNITSLISAIKNEDEQLFVCELDEAKHLGLKSFLGKIRFLVYGVAVFPKTYKDFPNNWDICINYSDFMTRFQWDINSQWNKKYQRDIYNYRIGLFLEGELYGPNKATTGVFSVPDTSTLWSTLTLRRSDEDNIKVQSEFNNLLHKYVVDGSYYSGWVKSIAQKFASQDEFAIWFNSVDISALKEKCERYLSVATYALLEKRFPEVNEEYNEKWPKDAIFLREHDRRRIIPYLCQLEPLSDEQISTIGDYVIYITYLAQQVYKYSKDVINEENRVIMKWLLDSSIYSETIMSLKTDVSLKTEEVDKHKSDNNESFDNRYSDDNQISDNQLPETFFTLQEPMTEDQFKLLHELLIDNEFICSTTKIDNLKQVFGVPRSCNFKRVNWIKMSTKNILSKRSLLNFLRLMAIDWEDLKPKTINICFRAVPPQELDTDKDYKFKYNDFSSSDYKEYDRYFISEYENDLKKILLKVFENSDKWIDRINKVETCRFKK